jgi:Baseplate J-like protein
MQLSQVKPDMESIREQLQATLVNYSAWRDLLPSGTGSALTDWISAVGAQDQYAIEHAFRESFRTARLDSSVLAQAILLGVRLPRKLSCSTTVSFSKTTTDIVTIPPYTQFTTNNSVLFNREAITVYGTTAVTASLFEGEIRVQNLIGNGTDYQLFVSADDRFTVSDIDVNVQLNDVTIPRSIRGLWTLANLSGVQDTTTPTGQLLLTFGSVDYGSVPQTSDRLKITYAVTRGELGQNAGLANENVQCNDFRQVSGVALTALTGGGDEKSPEFFRRVGPQLFAAKGGATTEDEYSAVAASYPGVLDALALGQRNVAPGDVRWMNMVQMSILTATPWTGAQWDIFDKWFRARSMYPVRLYRRDPVPRTVDITATVFCQGRGDLVNVKARVTQQIQKLFAARSGIIDSNIYLNDIHAAIKGSDNTVEYAELATPATDILVSAAAPDVLTLTAVAGNLPPGQYSYAVTTITAQGESLATNFTSIVLTTTGGVKIDWEPVQTGINYSIYGRTPLTLGLIGNTPSTEFTDNAATVPATSVPLVNGLGHVYPKLGILTLTLKYTDRSFYNLGSLR